MVGSTDTRITERRVLASLVLTKKLEVQENCTGAAVKVRVEKTLYIPCSFQLS